MSTAQPRGTESSLSRNLRVLATRNFLYGLRMNMMRAVWQPFVLHLGASMSLLGLLEAIGGFGGIVSTATLPLSGWLSDRRGRKPLVRLSHAFAATALLTFIIAGWVREWLLLLPGVVLLGLTAIARPAADSMVAESATPDARGRAFSLTGMAFAASGVFAPTLGGFLAERYGFLIVLATGIVLELVTLAVVASALRETLQLDNRAPLIASDFLGLLGSIMKPPTRLRSFYVAVAVDMFAFGAGSAILPGLLTETYHFTPFQLGLMSSVTSATWALSQLFFGRQVDKRGCVPFLILSEAIGAVVTGAWLVIQSFEAFLILQVLWGLVPAMWVPAFLAWIANSVPESQRAEEIGRLGAFRGLLSFPAPYVGGLLYELVGFRGPILANMIGAAMVVVLVWLFVGEPQSCGDAV
ncbi:MAG: MFS transporter [Anaerolineales bacterium]|nr:MAG: MFS transporter [Anaerolineales bacterium]